MSEKYYDVAVHEAINHLIVDLERYLCPERVEAIICAINLALLSHHASNRDSGEKYILHPLMIASRLAKLNQDTDVLISAICHDLVEDSDIDLQKIHRFFGGTVAMLVDGLTKFNSTKFPHKGSKNWFDVQTFFKLLKVADIDTRVVLIKAADVIHNLQTLDHVKPRSGITKSQRQTRFALKALCFHAPLARLAGYKDISEEIEKIAAPYLSHNPMNHNATSVRPCGYYHSPQVVRAPAWSWMGRCRHNPVYTLPMQRCP